MAAPEPKSSNRRSREYDVTQDIGCALTQTTRAYQRALNAELAPYGVTFRQSQVLGWVRMKRDLSQCDLARLLTIEPATLAVVLERMEHDGLISRTTDSTDHRRKITRLSNDAEELCTALAECATRVHARATQGLGSEQLDCLCKLLKRIMDNMGEPQGE